MRYKIVLADDHELLLEGIHASFRDVEDIEIVGMAGSGTEALELIRATRPDLLLLDLNMPQLDGLQTLKQVKRDHPKVKVVILSNYQQPELIEEIRQLGAEGYLVKNSGSAELKQNIRLVLEGSTVFPADDELRKVKPDSFFFDDFLRKYQLTRRELEIIRLVCQGRNSREIAAQLFLSEFTIHTHRKNILRKTGAANAAELINFARENGVV